MRLKLQAVAPMRSRHLQSLGCQVEFSAFPELSGTYACDAGTMAELRAIAVDCSVGHGLPFGADFVSHTTMDGVAHQFDAGQLQSLYLVLRDYVTHLGYYASRDVASPPPQPVLIP